MRVEHLTGATGCEYTLSTLSNNFPASPPPSVPDAIFTQYPRDHLTVPYARQATLAVSSEEYVFYAVNPAQQVYAAYFDFCTKKELLPQFGIIMTSSFSPIRIWRVDAYQRCNAAPIWCCRSTIQGPSPTGPLVTAGSQQRVHQDVQRGDHAA